MAVFASLRRWAHGVKRDGVTLWFAMRHAQVPWPVKALGAFVVAYALSPIDLIPDFIPILGYLDDVILLPVLIWLAIRLIPTGALTDCRAQADHWMHTTGKKPKSWVGAALIVCLWIAVAWLLWRAATK
jgi:uncharacterized membrane protein YkvA (DUF1232 family)